MTTTRAIRRIFDRKAQDAETYLYWRSRTSAERMQAVAELVRDAYAMKGVDVDAQVSKRTIVRIQRTKD